MDYVTKPINNEKSMLVFRGIVIHENHRQAKILNAMTALAKVFQEIEHKAVSEERENEPTYFD